MNIKITAFTVTQKLYNTSCLEHYKTANCILVTQDLKVKVCTENSILKKIFWKKIFSQAVLIWKQQILKIVNQN